MENFISCFLSLEKMNEKVVVCLENELFSRKRYEKRSEPLAYAKFVAGFYIKRSLRYWAKLAVLTAARYLLVKT